MADLSDLTEQFNAENILYFWDAAPFCETLKNAIHDMDEALADLMGMLDDADILNEITEDDDNFFSASHTPIAANYNQAPHKTLDETLEFGAADIDQDVIEINDIHDAEEAADLHDHIITAMDRVLQFYAFVLKNQAFMRPAIARIRNEVAAELDISAEIYADPANIYEEIEWIKSEVFPVLERLREHFTQELIEERMETGWDDDFAINFIDCAEICPDDIYKRMEYMFFEDFKIPLGIFDDCDDVHERQREHMQNSAYTQALIDDFKSGDLTRYFPGFTLVEFTERQNSPQTADIITQNARNLFGANHTPRPLFKPRHLFAK